MSFFKDYQNFMSIRERRGFEGKKAAVFQGNRFQIPNEILLKLDWLRRVEDIENWHIDSTAVKYFHKGQKTLGFLCHVVFPKPLSTKILKMARNKRRFISLKVLPENKLEINPIIE